MAAYLFAVALGNAFTALVNHMIRSPDGSSKWTQVEYYAFFVYLMLGTAIVFVPFACVYRERSYLQGDEQREEAAQHTPEVQITASWDGEAPARAQV